MRPFFHQAITSSLIAVSTVIALLPSQNVQAAASAELAGFAVGSIPGQLSVDQGAANYSIPIGVPKGVAGVEPELAFGYSSMGGGGAMGIGWSVGGLSSISRCSATETMDGENYGVEWREDDRYCLDGQRLLVVSGNYGENNSTYTTEIQSFARITAHGQAGNGPAWFSVETKSGQTIEFGNTTDSQVIAHERSEVMTWVQNKISDAVGNSLNVSYWRSTEHTEANLSEISYAGNQVIFDYIDLPESKKSENYASGVLVKQTKQLSGVRVLSDDALLSEYKLTYKSRDNKGDILTGLTQCDGLGKCLKPLSFTWDEDDSTFKRYEPLTTEYVVQEGNQCARDHKIVNDFDGDRRADAKNVLFQSYGPPYSHGSVVVELSKRDGYAASENWINNQGYLGDKPIRLADLNGDGLQDAFMGSYQAEAWFSNGKTLQKYSLLNEGVFADMSRIINGEDHFDAWGKLVLEDVNNDGLLDLKRYDGVIGDSGSFGEHDYYAATTYKGVYLAKRQKPELITQFTDSLGNQIKVNYQEGQHFIGNVLGQDEANVCGVMTTVATVEKGNGKNGFTKTSYQFGGAKAHVKGRGFLGYGWDEVTDESTGITTRTEYHQDFPYIGMPSSVSTFKEDGTVLSSSTSTFDEIITIYDEIRVDGSSYNYQTHFPYLSEKIENSFELGGSLVSSVTTKQSGYDTYGNVGTVEVITSAGGETYKKITTNIYDNNISSTKWHLGRLREATVLHTHHNGSTITRKSAFEYNAITGLLEKEIVEPDQPAYRQITTYEYDAFGNKVKVSVSGHDVATRTTTSSYDPSGRFVTNVANSLGHTETRVYDQQHGKAISLTGPNGLTTEWEYDSWGRKTAEHRADGTSSLITREWVVETETDEDPHAPTNAIYKVSTQSPVILNSDGSIASSAAPASTQYYDKLGRVIRKLSIGFDGQATYQDIVFDAQGREEKSSLPYFEGDSAYWAVNHYDEVNRVYKKTFDSGKDVVTTQITFNGLTTTNINTLGQSKVTTKNALGKVSEVLDEEGGKVTYEYDAIGNLLKTHQHDDANGKIITTELQYDVRGQKIGMIDPDMGQWQYTYNTFGELVSQTDAKGQVTSMQYDALGRMTLRLEVDGVSTWEYDTAANGVGKLASVSQYDVPAPEFISVATLPLNKRTYLQTPSYDSVGRANATSTQIDGKTFVTATDYDEYGRVYKTYRPNGFEIRNLYNANGYLLAKQSPAGEVGDYDLAHLQSLQQQSIDSANEAIAKASELATKVAYFTAKADEYRSYLAEDWSDVVTVSQSNGVTSPTVLYAGTANIAPPLQGSYKLYASSNNVAGSASSGYVIRHLSSGTDFTLSFYAQETLVCGKFCTTYNAGWHYFATISANIDSYIADGTYVDLSENVEITDIGGDGTLDLIRASSLPAYSLDFPQGILVNTPLVGNSVDLYDGTGYSLYKPVSTASTIDTNSLYLNDGQGSTHYRLWLDDQQWQWEAYTQAVWDNLIAPELEETTDKLFLGDFDGNGEPDAIRLPAMDPNLITTLTDELKAELLALVEDSNAAANALILEFTSAMEVAESLVLVAVNLNDKVRQAQYWADASLTADLDAMDGSDGYTTWWRATTRDAAGRLSAHRVGNGLVTINDYDPATGQLNSIQSGFGIGNLIRSLDYEYDALNNVSARYDNVQNVQETFVYDRLNRLTQSTTDGEQNAVPYTNTVDYSYDALGNMLNKSDVGLYQYGNSNKTQGGNAGPHAIRQVDLGASGFDEYLYDANGSVLSGGGRDVHWTSFNKPSYFAKDGNVIEFNYGPDRKRFKKTSVTDNFTAETTLYLGKAYERIEDQNGQITHKHFVYIEGQIAAIHIEKEDGNGVINNNLDETRYLHRDSLGSIDTITNGLGEIVSRQGFSAFGARRGGNWDTVAGIPLALYTNRGFTGHEHIDEVGLIHMNGRVYDPELGRFLSADPHVQAPYNSQSYNRYSYVLNNPLKYTDPSGYFFKKLFRAIKRVLKNPLVRMAIGIALAYFGGLAVLNHFGYGGFQAAINAAGGIATVGASVGGTTALVAAGATGGFIGGLVASGGDLKAALTGAATGALSGFIGGSTIFGGLGNITAERVLAHGVVGGISSEVSGGKFIQGFASSTFTKSISGNIKSFASRNPIGGAIASAVIGGTASRITGGKFANGASTSGFQYLFNAATSAIQKQAYAESDASLKSYTAYVGTSAAIGAAGGIVAGGFVTPQALIFGSIGAIGGAIWGTGTWLIDRIILDSDAVQSAMNAVPELGSGEAGKVAAIAYSVETAAKISGLTADQSNIARETAVGYYSTNGSTPVKAAAGVFSGAAEMYKQSTNTN